MKTKTLKLSIHGLMFLTLLLCGGLWTYAQTPGWSYTGSLNTPRYKHTATLLPNGQVLVAGGINNFTPNGSGTNTAELYDPSTGTWSITGSLNMSRYDHTATLLPNGLVLVAGGVSRDPNTPNTTELFDPTTGTWRLTGTLHEPRLLHTATLLRNGKVLIAGGGKYIDQGSGSFSISRLTTTELYDPATGLWSVADELHTQRIFHTATLLPNGKVLVAGGCLEDWCLDDDPLDSGELYDPNTGAWSVTGRLNTPRVRHTATLLPDGRVLVAGGDFGNSASYELYNPERYNPATGSWSVTGPLTRRDSHTATFLADGKVLVAGGYDDPYHIASAAELYDPAAGGWSITSSLNTPRYNHTATLLPNGKVLVVGGYGGTYPPTILRSAELYDSGSSSASNPIDDTQFFVRQQYRDFLNREADPDGLNFWSGEIFACGLDQQCIEAKRINDSGAFFLSIEFQETGYLLYRLNKVAYGNLPSAPVPLTYSDFGSDAPRIGQDVVVNQAGWRTVLESNKQTFANEFVQRPRFTSAYPPSMSAADFVDALNANAGSVLSQTERDHLVSDLSSGAMTRAQVLRAVAEDPDLVAAEFNRAFVLMQYFGYLRRNPNDAPDGNFNGYNFWLDKLNQFNGDFVGAEMVRAFLISDEYRHRFGP